MKHRYSYSPNYFLSAIILLLFFCSPVSFAKKKVNLIKGADFNTHSLEIDSLPSSDFIYNYGNLNNFLFSIRNKKQATVAFLGGSITAGNGWRDKVMDYLERRYSDTRFTFINAGIPSLGSVPHAFRLRTDVLSKGTIDLLFVESAVNDLANGTPVFYQRRALEGIVRHALKFNPSMNIVMMAFVDEIKIKEYNSGKIPAEVQVHDDVARHYLLPFINLAQEVTKRIDAKEFTWQLDFKDLHPSPFGQELYFRTIKRLIEISSVGKFPSRIIPVKLSSPLEKFNYSSGKYISVNQAKNLKGFEVNPAWHPADSAKTRKGFVNVPMLVSQQAGSSFEFSFKGSAVGIALIAGPDAGTIEYTIDDSQEKTIDLFTQWSKSVHLPWYLMLGDNLASGNHVLKINITDLHNPKSIGTSCRIVHFLVNN